MFDIVVAADLDGGIGKDNGLPWPKLRGDMAHFRKVTSEAPAGQQNAVVMGRKTWQSSEVKERPLPRRTNVIVTRGSLTVPEGAVVAHTFDGALAACDHARAAATFLVGGAELYRIGLAHPLLRFVYLTRIDGRFGCDTHIPLAAIDEAWERDHAWTGDVDGTENDVRYSIRRLVRR